MLTGIIIQYILPYITIHIIDTILPNKDMKMLIIIVILLVFLNLIIYSSDIFSSMISYYLRERILLDFQIEVFKHAQYLSISQFDKVNIAEIISHLNKDIYNLRHLLADNILMMLKDIITMLIGLFWICKLNIIASLLVLPLILIIFCISGYTGKKIRLKISSYLSTNSEFFNSLILAIQNHFFIKIYAVEDFIKQKIAKLQNDQFILGYKLEKYKNISTGLIRFIISIPPIIVYLYGGMEIMADKFTLGEMIGFNYIISYILYSVYNLANTNLNIENGIVSLKRISTLMEIPIEKPTVKNQSRFRCNGNLLLKYDNITFSFDGTNPVLKNITFSIHSGEIIALVGNNGSGKSTMVKLLFGLYDDYFGNIYLNTTNVRDIDKSDLRKNIAYVPQDIYILDGTIKENILIGNPNASETEIILASQKAKIHEKIESFPSKYDTRLSINDIPFTGGEKQRLALARAFVRNSKILILDEATSQVDAKSEYLFKKIFRDYANHNAIGIVIAHSLSTVIYANRIIVLDKGQIKDIGNHSELYQRCKVYQEFCNYQLVKI
jgi:ATP-binding cassette, subfamily C, bacteriocin exporter